MLSASRLTPFLICFAASAFAQGPESFQDSWKSLAHKDADVSFAAMKKWAAVPQESIAFLGRIAIEKPDPTFVADLIQKLNSERFVERDKAAAELIKLKGHGYDALVKLAESATDLESKRRLKALVEDVGEARAAETRRWSRAVELLEWIATPEAKGLLQAWSQEQRSPRVEEVAAALERWSKNESALAFPQGPRLDAAGDPLPVGALMRLGTTRWRVDNFRDHVFAADGEHLIIADGQILKHMEIRTGKTTLRQDVNERIRSIELSPDGRRLLMIVGDMQSQAQIWDAKSFTKLADWASLPGRAMHPSAVRHSRDGQTVLVAMYRDNFIHECDAMTGKVIRSRELPKDYSVVALSETRAVLTGSQNNDRFLMYNWREDKREQRLPAYAEWMSEMVFSPDESMLAWRNAARKDIYLYDRTGKRGPVQIGGKDEGQRSIYSFGFAPDGKTLFISHWANEKSRNIAWDIESQKVRWQANGSLSSIAFSSDSRFVAGVSQSRIAILDLANGKQIGGGDDADFQSTAEIGFVNGQKLWTLAARAVRFWDLPSGRLCAEVAPAGNILLGGAAVSPDGQRFAATLTENPWGTWDRSLRIWNVATGAEAMRLPASPKIRHRDLAFSPGGKRLVSFGDDVLVRTWDSQNGRLLSEIDPTGHGRALVDDELTLGPVEARERLRGHGGTISRSLLAPEGALFYSQNGDKIDIFNTASGEKIAMKADTNSWDKYKVSADGRCLAASPYLGEPQGFFIYDLRQKMYRGLLRIRDDPGRFGTFALSADGRLLAVATTSNHVHVFETEALSRRLTIDLDSGATVLAFSPGGRFLAVVQANGSVLVYDLRRTP